MTVKDAIKELKRYKPGTPCAMALWLPEDVKSVAENFGQKLTEDEVAEVLYRVRKHHDCELGITWETLRTWMFDVISERKAK